MFLSKRLIGLLFIGCFYYISYAQQDTWHFTAQPFDFMLIVQLDNSVVKEKIPTLVHITLESDDKTFYSGMSKKKSYFKVLKDSNHFFNYTITIEAEGFLPLKKTYQTTTLEKYHQEPVIMVLYQYITPLIPIDKSNVLKDTIIEYKEDTFLLGVEVHSKTLALSGTPIYSNQKRPAGARAWRILGIPDNTRFYMPVTELSELPANTHVDSAFLALTFVDSYSYAAHVKAYNHTNNRVFIRRITTPWTSDEITWENQPAYTTKNQVTLPDISHTQKALNDSYKDTTLLINITPLVRDILKKGNHGLMFMLEKEEYFRAWTFVVNNTPQYRGIHLKLYCK